MKMIDERIATLTAEKKECLVDYTKTADEELHASLAMLNMRISMELKFLSELKQALVIKSVCGKCGNKNIKSENGKQMHCSWCDTDW